MKKNTILRYMGELSGRYLKLVFPKIEPHKCVKKMKRKNKGKNRIEKTDRNYMLYKSNRRKRGKERQDR